jgi:hypothetical protein
MKQLSITAGIAAIVGAAVALAVLGVRTQPAASSKKVAHATIHLVEVRGSCRIVTVPQTLELSKQERVQWTIIDLCDVTAGADVVVAFASDPLDPSCTKRGRKNITCNVAGNAAENVYKYTVSATGAITEDPELEILR